MGKFQVDLKTLISLKLGFEAYFILHCLYFKELEMLLSYTRTCKLIASSVFIELANSGYITIKGEYDINTVLDFTMLGLTDKGAVIFKKQISPAIAAQKFEEFRLNYPKDVKRGARVLRRLQGDKNRCINLYMNILNEGVPHELLCKAARIYSKEKEHDEYIQMLVTWLSKREYEQYLNDDDVDNNASLSNIELV